VISLSPSEIEQWAKRFATESKPPTGRCLERKRRRFDRERFARLLNFNFATSPPFRFIFRSGAINARHAIVEINFDQALPRGTES
jgi:hypothetical protein